RVQEICRTLRPLLEEAHAAGVLDRWLIVSRGDSTLRGHFPVEVEAIAAELGPFDATLLAPAFLPGGRTTRDGVHYLHGEPVHTTAFARDRLFGFRSSDLPAWVEEKTAGRINAAAVQRLGLAELVGPPEQLRARLAGLRHQQVVAVDAEQPEQLEALGAAVWAVSDPALPEPRRLLFQSAASLINGLVPLPPQPLDAAGLAGLRRRDGNGAPLPALVMVGSHVPLADQQLEALLQEPGCRGLELPVAKLARVLDGPAPKELLASLEQDWLATLRQLLQQGLTPVLSTSRGELSFASSQERRRFGLALAALMARMAAALAPQLGLIISKGGITTQVLLADGLHQASVELQGQLLPGLSLVLADDLPVITFPGNLGDPGTLRLAWRMLTT
ncbi:MAG: four-carbon acid sugar kinase family protein, partial [Vulcanococcus sp.]